MANPHSLSKADVARLEALACPDRWSLEDAIFVFDACHRTGLSVVKFAGVFGLETLIFEAPNKPSQFALLNHLGSRVHLCNVRLEEVLRVEIYRRGLHSDAFCVDALRPAVPASAVHA